MVEVVPDYLFLFNHTTMTCYWVGKIYNKNGTFGDGLITGYKDPDITLIVSRDYYIHILMSSVGGNIEVVRRESNRYEELRKLDYKQVDVVGLFHGMK